MSKIPRFLLAAALVAPLLAHAGHDDCASGISRSAACIDGFAMSHEERGTAAPMLVAVRLETPKAMAIRTQSLPAPFVLEAARPSMVTAAQTRDGPPAAQTGDPSILGLLFAAVGVLGFVAHRRSGR